LPDDSPDRTLSWDEKATEVPVRSEGELLARLHDIASEAGETPPLVSLSNPDGGALTIGLGREYSVVNYIRSVDEPDWISRGTLGRDESPVFYFHGHYSEFTPGSAVSVDEAVEAMLRFFRTGRRPENLEWDPS
jgi:immunity protein Imm1 of predicted polymorphic toxin system